MSHLFDNAIQSIQLGVEDYKNDDPKRAVSAARNFYAGVLLLAKEVLVRQVPKASPEDVISAKYKPEPDGKGGIIYTPESFRTIDFETINKRFKDFNLPINPSGLKHLSDIRNNLEHHFSDKPQQEVRDAIAKTFPFVSKLFRLIGEEPLNYLGGSWLVMLDLHVFYERELDSCRKSFDEVEWPSEFLTEVEISCPTCKSDLVEQVDPKNKSYQSLRCRCGRCGYRIPPEEAIESALKSHFYSEIYIAMTDGGELPVEPCPKCGFETYLLTEEEVGCVWCGLVLGECRSCGDRLMPNDAWFEVSRICSYCTHQELVDNWEVNSRNSV